MLIAVAAGIGNGVIFKLVPFYFNKQAGIANGIVSMMGGLGGFFPPLLLSIIHSMTGSYSIGFMAFSQVALASLVLVIWLYYMDRLSMSAEVFNSTGQGILVTDASGKIQSVNPAFTRLTGYTEEEVIGRIRISYSSGRHSKDFTRLCGVKLDKMSGWQGEIWNKAKMDEDYLQLLSISAVKDGSGEITHYVGTFSDITPPGEEGSWS